MVFNSVAVNKNTPALKAILRSRSVNSMCRKLLKRIIKKEKCIFLNSTANQPSIAELLPTTP